MTDCRNSVDTKCQTLNHYHSSVFNNLVPQYGHAMNHAVMYISPLLG